MDLARLSMAAASMDVLCTIVHIPVFRSEEAKLAKKTHLAGEV